LERAKEGDGEEVGVMAGEGEGGVARMERVCEINVKLESRIELRMGGEGGELRQGRESRPDDSLPKHAESYDPSVDCPHRLGRSTSTAMELRL
jgi:hypothetical protein